MSIATKHFPPPTIPVKEFKWKWASWAPTESLNLPTIYFGVLRALNAFEGSKTSDPKFSNYLSTIFENVNEVDIARTPDRNIIRNSGQYWKGKGLLKENRGLIALTNFGREVATGSITRAEFAATVIKKLETPNPNIQTSEEVALWHSKGIRIKPLELILSLLSYAVENDVVGIKEAYLTPEELGKIVVPLSATSQPIGYYWDAILAYRMGNASFNSWPNCVPGDNDLRVIREFLLFLHYYGYLQVVFEGTNSTNRFKLPSVDISDVRGFVSIEISDIDDENQAYQIIRGNSLTDSVERQRKIREIVERPQQQRFRKDVLREFGKECLVTRDNVPEALEAAHIIPVQNQGTDHISNGLCLRNDVHSLFDSGHLRIQPNGNISLSFSARNSPSYRDFPLRINIPHFVDSNALNWRLTYK